MAQGLISQRSRSVEPGRFAMVPRNDVPRSSFDVRHSHKTTFDGRYLVPVYVEEVLPGDSIRLRMTSFARLATAVVPVMDNLHLESFFFFVPNRLLWTNWTRFMGEKASTTDTTEFLVPQVAVTSAVCIPGSIYDYMGITLNAIAARTINVSALPFRAYQQIWNEWFRDQDLQDPLVEVVGDGPDADSAYSIQFRGKRHDYFTSARPWPQKPVNLSDSGVLGVFEPGGRMLFPQTGAPVTGLGVVAGAPTAGAVVSRQSGGRVVTIDPTYPATLNPLHVKALSSQFPDVRVLINDIRLANTVQIMMERDARGGTRYTEKIRTHFGVVSPDARLQRPEYLGGGRGMVTIHPLAQTSASGLTGGTTVLGELSGVGTAIANHGFSQSFTEHGVILGLVQVRADLSYQNGINRMWFRRTQYDFYWPALAHLGEQAILSKEIWSAGEAGDDTVFGYQERWAEYRSKPSRVSGRFRSTAPSTLDVWHFSQNFLSRPVLSAGFIADGSPINRVLQVPGEFEEFLFDAFFDVRMVRAMPMFSIPGMGPRL